MFENIVGHELIKKYFKKVLDKKNISHSYIFYGQTGVGKHTMARMVAKSLLCEQNPFDTPCEECKSCFMINSNNNPDLIEINKDTQIIKIESIKEKLIKNINIKPYFGKYKIYIISDADTLQADSQNAILKTIEEPPIYAIIILMTTSIDKLLPTIQSRCIPVYFNNLTYEEVTIFSKNLLFDMSYQDIYIKFANGSIGKLKNLIDNPDFLPLRAMSVKYLSDISSAGLPKLYGIIDELVENKDKLNTLLDYWLLWYRDIFLYKRIQTTDLYYSDYLNEIICACNNISYSKISSDINTINNAKVDINKNVYLLLVIENLLLKLKERKNDSNNRC
ncbi:MAG: hypothetical protein BEN19_08390 [Epulopiscium sp. Nuni2H_MBin003]|nr:MAG: hypothetical protein BEN19_08390 [Epulopiscium sp. Nuni2H_MBin003]